MKARMKFTIVCCCELSWPLSSFAVHAFLPTVMFLFATSCSYAAASRLKQSEVGLAESTRGCRTTKQPRNVRTFRPYKVAGIVPQPPSSLIKRKFRNTSHECE